MGRILSKRTKPRMLLGQFQLYSKLIDIGTPYWYLNLSTFASYCFWEKCFRWIQVYVVLTLFKRKLIQRKHISVVLFCKINAFHFIVVLEGVNSNT